MGWTENEILDAIGDAKTRDDILCNLHVEPKNKNRAELSRHLNMYKIIFRTRKYSDNELRVAVEDSFSYADVLKKLGIKQAGGNQGYLKKRVAASRIDTRHFKGFAHNKGKPSPRKPPHEVLCKIFTGKRTARLTLLRALLKIGRKYVCEDRECTVINKWKGADIVLHIHHINSDWTDNRPENLIFLCPNCHSQYDRKICYRPNIVEMQEYRELPINIITVQETDIIMPHNFVSRTSEKSKCPNSGCLNQKEIKSVMCTDCNKKSKRPHRELINWPTNEELIEKLQEISYSQLARELSCSDNAIRKRFKSQGIKPPIRRN